MAHPVDPKKLHDAAQQIETANKASAETRALEDAASAAAAKARDARLREGTEHRIADNALRDAGAQPVHPTGGFDLGEGPVPADRLQQPAVVEREPIYRSHPAAFTIGIIALVLAALALIFGLAALLKGGDSSSVNNAIAQANNATSVAVKADAKADMALDTAKRADSKADKAIEKATQAQAAASTCNACCKVCSTAPPVKHKRKPQPKHAAVITEPRQAHPGPRVVTAPIWLWHDPYATSENPKPCVIESGNGAGLPPYCSSFTVNGRRDGESKHEWLLRVGGGVDPTDTGLYHKSNKPT